MFHKQILGVKQKEARPDVTCQTLAWNPGVALPTLLPRTLQRAFCHKLNQTAVLKSELLFRAAPRLVLPVRYSEVQLINREILPCCCCPSPGRGNPETALLLNPPPSAAGQRLSRCVTEAITAHRWGWLTHSLPNTLEPKWRSQYSSHSSLVKCLFFNVSNR